MFNRKIKKRVALAEQAIIQLKRDIEVLNFKLNNKPKFKKGDKIGHVTIIGDAFVSSKEIPFHENSELVYSYPTDNGFTSCSFYSENTLIELQKQEAEKRDKEYKHSKFFTDLSLAMALAWGVSIYLSEDEKKTKKDKKSKKEKDGKNN